MDTTIIKATGDSLSALTSALTKYDEHLDFRTIIKSEKETLVEIAPKSKDDHTVSYSVWDGAWINYRATSTFEVTDKQAVEVVKLASMINNEILCGAFACSVPDKDQRLHVIYSNTIVADDFSIFG